MFELICQGCGKVFMAERMTRMFCSHVCASTNRSRSAGTASCDTSLEWKRTEGNHLVWECPYNKAVGCSFRKCDRCGWNPEVAKARLEKIMEARREG
jgi:hypothetical protein